jgi:hypothetical protein
LGSSFRASHERTSGDHRKTREKREKVLQRDKKGGKLISPSQDFISELPAKVKEKYFIAQSHLNSSVSS